MVHKCADYRVISLGHMQDVYLPSHTVQLVVSTVSHMGAGHHQAEGWRHQ
jgi:hypothetical protein